MQKNQPLKKRTVWVWNKYDDEVIHWSFFKKEEETYADEIMIENGIDETG